jgi:hypothetical protein
MSTQTATAMGVSGVSGATDGTVSEGMEGWEWRWAPWLTVLGAACIVYGILWDISWHSTIGRDTFWTPAHLMIQFGGILGGCLGGWIVLASTFWRREEWRGRTVGVLGFRGPLGAWILVWGAVAMVTSAPFDDWWHAAYGLDVKILSPPHALLAAGMYAVVSGSVVLVVSDRNRRGGEPANWMLVVAGGVQLALASVLLTEVSFPNLQRTATFYLASAVLYPGFLMAVVRQWPVRMPATGISLIYMGLIGSMVWLLPMFRGEPGLAPIYNPVTTMVPPAFPLLLVAPALVLDGWGALARRWGGWRGEVLLVVGGAVLFCAVFLPVQWYFSGFLLGPGADNAFFAGNRFFSYMSSRSWAGRFWGLDRDPVTLVKVGWMLGIALVSSGLGVLGGRFLSKVRR